VSGERPADGGGAPGADKPELVSGPIYVPTFDAFRGAAVLTIVVYHLFLRSEWVPPGEFPRALLTSGYMSLDLLFLISGFVMFLPVAARGTLGDLRAFSIRRVARIAPAYYICLAAIIALWPLLTFGRDVLGPSPWEPLPLLWHVLFLHNEVAIAYPAYFPGFAVNPALWTLSVEMVFYVVLALVAVAYLRRPWLGLAIGIAVTVVWRIALDPPDNFFQNAFAPPDIHLIWKQFPLFAVDFAAGMTAAWVLVKLRRGPGAEHARRVAAPVAAVSLALFLGLMTLVGFWTTPSRDPIAIAGAGFQEPVSLAILVPLVFAVFAVSTDFLAPRLSRPLTHPLSRGLGEISYSIYLYHLIVIQLCVAWLAFPTEGRPIDLVRLAAVVLPVSIALGWLSYTFVERPARRRAQAWSKRIRERAAEPVRPAGAAALAAPTPGSREAPPAGS
jgi:peptidoglycan/LPS O-acetylase OafA/YrhL